MSRSAWPLLVLLALMAALALVWGLDVRPDAAVPEAPPAADTAALPEAPPPAAPKAPEPEPPALRQPLPADTAAAPGPVLPSGLVIPVAGVAPGDLVDTFTAARAEGRQHDAIDILAPRGTPVVAAADGRILRLFTSERGGLTVYQLGADGRTVYYYAHLDRYADGLAQGQSVRRGQRIGYVGDTGNATPGNHHLHFAIWTVDDPKEFWDGPAVNPYPLLGGR